MVKVLRDHSLIARIPCDSACARPSSRSYAATTKKAQQRKEEDTGQRRQETVDKHCVQAQWIRSDAGVGAVGSLMFLADVEKGRKGRDQGVRRAQSLQPTTEDITRSTQHTMPTLLGQDVIATRSRGCGIDSDERRCSPLTAITLPVRFDDKVI